MREDFQRVMKDRYSDTIKELTGRNVVAFLSQAHVEPDITMEIFFIDGPLPGFGALRSSSVPTRTWRRTRPWLILDSTIAQASPRLSQFAIESRASA